MTDSRMRCPEVLYICHNWFKVVRCHFITWPCMRNPLARWFHHMLILKSSTSASQHSNQEFLPCCPSMHSRRYEIDVLKFSHERTLVQVIWLHTMRTKLYIYQRIMRTEEDITVRNVLPMDISSNVEVRLRQQCKIKFIPNRDDQ